MNQTDNIQNKRGCDQIIDYFMPRILSGEMKAKEKLPSEAQLCQQFSVSRTVIREAIQQLKARGAIETINGKGSFIAERRMDHFRDSLKLYSSQAGDLRDWNELLSLRSLIETACLRTVMASALPQGFQQLKSALEAMRQQQNNLKKFAEADIEFHHIIVTLSENRLYQAVWESLQGISLKFAHTTYQKKEQAKINLAV